MVVLSPAHGGVRFAEPLTPRLLSRHKDSIQERRNTTSTVVCRHNPGNALTRVSLRGRLTTPRYASSNGTLRSLDSTSSSFFSSEDQEVRSSLLPILKTTRGHSTKVQARTGRANGLSHPAQMEKPEWWLRALAAAPYLIACQLSDVGYYIQPLLRHYEMFEELMLYIPGAIKRWSVWFPMVYCMAVYTGVVKNKKWPHFLRYHMIMGMLLETAVQIVWVASNWFPLIHFNGKFGMYYWAVVGLLYMGVLLDGARCALGGNYFKIPFVSEAALIHTDTHVGGFQRPF